MVDELHVTEARLEPLAEDGKKYERSTIQFPYGDLDDAVVVAKTLHRESGGHARIDQLVAWLGHKALDSGGFRTKLATARVFGLIETTREHASLTPLGQRVIDPEQEAQARVEAFLAVPLYRVVFDRYRGRLLPPDVGLEREMVNLGVAPKQGEKARQAFQRSAAQAGFFGQGRDRLVLPAFASNGEATHPPAESDSAGARPVDRSRQPVRLGGGGEPPGPGRHPLIDGLFTTLPPANSRWSQEKRKQWLQAAEAIFGLVYADDEA